MHLSGRGRLSVSFQLPFPGRIGDAQAGVMCCNSGSTCLLFLYSSTAASLASPMQRNGVSVCHGVAVGRLVRTARSSAVFLYVFAS
jgi:hypothetical protein